MGADKARGYASTHEEEIQSRLIEFLKIPSISTLPDHAVYCDQAARWLGARMEQIGLDNVEVIEGVGHPLVYADWLHAEGAPTVLLYGHYDVQPVDPIDLWTTPPFQPTVRDGYLYARGAVDDKGQVAALIEAAGAYLQTDGRLPVNLRFLIEGEEESGGEHIKQFLATGDRRLKADFAHVSDSSFFDEHTPSVCTGLRGIVYAEIHVRAVDHDLHSGEYGGVAPNPLISLAHIISRLRDSSGEIFISGFFDDVATPETDVLTGWRALNVSPEQVAQEIGASRLIGDERFTPIERMWSRPTFDVHGIPGGFTAEGAKTVIPAVAAAKVSMRLVPDQKADHIFELFAAAVKEAAPADVDADVRLIHADDPVVVPSDTPQIRAAREALRETFGREAVLIRSGGSIPIVGGFQEELGLSSVLLGYGLPGDNLHAPDERFRLDQFHGGIQTNIVFWDLAGKA